MNGDASFTALAGTAVIVGVVPGTNFGTLDLGGGNRTFTVADGSAQTDLSIGVNIVNGAITKTGTGRIGPQRNARQHRRLAHRESGLTSACREQLICWSDQSQRWNAHYRLGQQSRKSVQRRAIQWWCAGGDGEHVHQSSHQCGCKWRNSECRFWRHPDDQHLHHGLWRLAKPATASCN